MSTFPTVHVEIGFPGVPSTAEYLHLNDAVRGKLNTATLAPDLVFTDISSFTRRVTLTRGSNRVEGPVIRYEAGTAEIVLDNSDRRFDPTNLSGPYVSGGVTQVTPMRVVRVWAEYGGDSYQLWRGFIDEWDISYSAAYSEATIRATDGFKVLQSFNRVASGAVGSGELSGARVNRILNSVSWSTTDRVIATGDSTLQSTTLEGTGLDELFQVNQTEVGELYMDGSGRVVFRNRHAIMEESRSNSSQATLGDGYTEMGYSDIDLVYDDETIVNLAQATRTGGAVQTASDTTSQTNYLVHTYEVSDLLLETDAATLDWARFVVQQQKDPELRFASITIPAHEVTKNKVTNTSFEAGIYDWAGGGSVPPTLSQSSTHVFDGSQALLVTWGTNGSVPLAGIMVRGLVPGSVYTASAYVWTPTGDPHVFLLIPEGSFGNASTLHDQYQRITVTFTATMTTMHFQVWPDGVPTSGDQCWVDAVQVEEGSTATTFESTPDIFTQVLSREIGDRVTVRRTPPGSGSPAVIEREVFIRGIRHDITDKWFTTFAFQSATKYAFLVLNHASLGKLNQNSLMF